MPFKLGPWEIAIILVVILVIFGVGKLPQIGNGVGKTLREFKKFSRGEFDEETKPVTTGKIGTKTVKADVKAK